MLLWKTLNLADHERALLYRRGRLVDLLGPGHYRFSALRGEIKAEVFDITAGPFRHDRQHFLLHQFGFLLGEHLQTFATCEHQVGLIYRDARLVEILPPASSLTLWRDTGRLHLETVDIAQVWDIAKPVLECLAQARTRPELGDAVDAAMSLVLVKDNQLGVMSVDGCRTQLLKPGCYGFWRFNRTVDVDLLSLAPMKHSVDRIDCLTEDGYAVNMDLVAWSEVADVDTYIARKSLAQAVVTASLRQHLHGAAQTCTLAELLADATTLQARLVQSCKAHLAAYGVALHFVGVMGVRLPGSTGPANVPAARYSA